MSRIFLILVLLPLLSQGYPTDRQCQRECQFKYPGTNFDGRKATIFDQSVSGYNNTDFECSCTLFLDWDVEWDRQGCRNLCSEHRLLKALPVYCEYVNIETCRVVFGTNID